MRIVNSRDEVVKRACCERPCGFGPVGKAFSHFGSRVAEAPMMWPGVFNWLIRDLRWEREKEKGTKEVVVESGGRDGGSKCS